MHDRRAVLDWNCMEKDTFGEGYTHEEDGETFLLLFHFLTSSSCHPKIFVKEFSYFLMPCHQHCLGVNLLVQR